MDITRVAKNKNKLITPLEMREGDQSWDLVFHKI